MNFKFFLLIACFIPIAGMAAPRLKMYQADHPFIRYTGRVDITNQKFPRFWQPGVYITARFTGSECEVILNDERLWGKNQNYLEIVMDGKPMRLRTKSSTDTISVIADPGTNVHTILICKNTEANIGWLELVGIRCSELLQPLPEPQRRIEYIGNSITCGTGSDISEIPCGKGAWQDQRNVYMSYGAVMARGFNASYHLSSVSGIGLLRSCCGMNIVMPGVFDKVKHAKRYHSLGL